MSRESSFRDPVALGKRNRKVRRLEQEKEAIAISSVGPRRDSFGRSES